MVQREPYSQPIVITIIKKTLYTNDFHTLRNTKEELFYNKEKHINKTKSYSSYPNYIEIHANQNENTLELLCEKNGELFKEDIKSVELEIENENTPYTAYITF